MINDQSEIFRPAARPTNHIGQSGQIEMAPLGGTARIEIAGWVIQVAGDALIINCAGDVTTSTRTGRLDQKQVVVKRESPASNSRPTELGLQTSVLPAK